MTTLPLYPQPAPASADALSPAQQLKLLAIVSAHLDHLAMRLIGQGARVETDREQAVTQLERLDLLTRHGATADGEPFVTLTREAFTTAFDLYRADMTAQGGEGCL